MAEGSIERRFDGFLIAWPTRFGIRYLADERGSVFETYDEAQDFLRQHRDLQADGACVVGFYAAPATSTGDEEQNQEDLQVALSEDDKRVFASLRRLICDRNAPMSPNLIALLEVLEERDRQGMRGGRQ